MLWSIVLKLEFSDSQLHYGFFPEIDWLENMPVVLLCKGTRVCLTKDLNIDICFIRIMFCREMELKYKFKGGNYIKLLKIKNLFIKFFLYFFEV